MRIWRFRVANDAHQPQTLTVLAATMTGVGEEQAAGVYADEGKTPSRSFSLPPLAATLLRCHRLHGGVAEEAGE